jgi:hypothetical protein
MAHEPWFVEEIGEVASHALARHCTGVVLAVFARSIYLHLLGDHRDYGPRRETLAAAANGYDTDNALVCITDRSLGAGPLHICTRNLRTSLRDAPNTVTAGDSVRVNHHERMIHIHRTDADKTRTGIALAYTAASTRGDTQNIRRCHNRERAFQTLFQSLSLSQRLSPSPLQWQQSTFGLAPGLQEQAVRSRSNITLQELRNWLFTNAPRGSPARHTQSMVNEPPGTIRDLIGLGEGLTPAGDDYLAGILIGLRYCARDAAADKLSHYLHVHLKSRTNRISRAHLACVRAGYYQTSVVDLLVALDHGAQRVDCAIRQLTDYGHTSGLDLLAGFSTALESSAGSTISRSHKPSLS